MRVGVQRGKITAIALPLPLGKERYYILRRRVTLPRAGETRWFVKKFFDLVIFAGPDAIYWANRKQGT